MDREPSAARGAPARIAHLLADLRERLAAFGLVADDEFQFPVTQPELADAPGMSFNPP